jgi:NADH:ubiquinone oxidoreductase subunit 6 (subunit J)
MFSFNSFFALFINTLIAFTLGRSSLVFLVSNPIHSILSLIGVFFLGTCLLFFIQREYYARLFLIVYVGAIVVLFLFIIMMLELKRVNITQSLYNSYLIHYSFILTFFLIALLIMSETRFNLRFIINANLGANLDTTFFTEANMYLDWSKLIQRTDQLRALGGILYTEYKVSVILASILLFLSMVGALALTLFFPSSKKFYKKYATSLKVQDNNNQTIRFGRLS